VPTNNLLARSDSFVYSDPASLTTINAATVTNVGGSQPHNNMQPYLTLNFCIALQGIFPSRN
jgi:microcystin-dependent protein